MKKWDKVSVWWKKNYEVKIKKEKTRWTKINKELLKNTVFEMISFWFTLNEIADKTWYSTQHIANMSCEIDNEFMIDLWKDRDYQIRKHIKKLEWVSKKLYKSLYEVETDDIKWLCKLQDQILKTMQFIAKLQWLLVDINEVNVKDDTVSDVLKMYEITDNE